jgi:hypothetical protein
MVFPEFIYVTNKRPDIVIYSRETCHVMLIELTCPAEEGILPAQVRKKARYTPLKESIEARKIWTVELMTVEAGARGFVARSMNSCLRKLGFSANLASKVCKEVSLIVAKCSHTIWTLHKQKLWRKRSLLSPDDGVGAKDSEPKVKP